MPKPRESAGGLVTNPDMDVLLVMNLAGRCTFPQGRVRKKINETPMNAAFREVNEETGIKKKNLVVVRYIGEFSRIGRSNVNEDSKNVIKEVAMFQFTTEQMLLRPITHDVLGAFWTPTGDVTERLYYPEEQDFFTEHQHILGTT